MSELSHYVVEPEALPTNEAIESLIVLSDVHLGCDLVEHAPLGNTSARTKEVDEDLIQLVEHYRANPPERGRWRLVVAGDLIDFIGMSLSPIALGLSTAPNEEELAHGLGNAADHALLKMRAVARRHREVFAALARFVAAGNAMTIIHGNHDLELYWEVVRTELSDTLAAHAAEHAAERGAPFDREAFLAAIEYSPWFFYRDGMAYVEHGHQYDPFCSTEHVLAPVSPADPRRVVRSFAEILLRFVVRQTAGVTEDGHEQAGLLTYLLLAWRLGVRGGAALGFRYVRALAELFRVRRMRLRGATARLRREHEEAMERLSVARRVSLEKLRALGHLQVAPVTRTVLGIMGSLLADRITLGIFSAMVLAGLGVASFFNAHAAWAIPLVLVFWVVAHRWLHGQRRIDPFREIAARLPALARLFPAPFIVMGHTHVPARSELDGSTYINVGSWHEQEEGGRAARTHVVIHPGLGRPIAHFLRWDRELGPMTFETV